MIDQVPGSLFERCSVYFTQPSSPCEASMTPFSSSSARCSCSGLILAIATTLTSLMPSPSQIAQLPVHLGLHVERLLAAALPALVGGDHERADLLAECLVVRHRLGLGQSGVLGVDV